MVVADPLPHLTLVSGPARSGKSRWAEHLAQSSGQSVVYVATGPELPNDPNWQERLRRHRERRPSSWQLWEVGGQLSAALARLEASQLALVDSLGTWVASHLDQDPVTWQSRVDDLLDVVVTAQAKLVLVGEECGWGVVPPTALGGLFRDRLGDLQQRLALQAGASWLVIQGRALPLHELALRIPGEP